MARKRKKTKNRKKKQKYIPIVVLNNRIPVNNESKNEKEPLAQVTPPTINRRILRPKLRNILYYQDRRRIQRPPRIDRRLGEVYDDLGGSKSERISGSHSGGGSCCGGSGSGGFGLTNTEALIFLAALAFAVAFLNQQITMFLGGRRKRRRRREANNNYYDTFNESTFFTILHSPYFIFHLIFLKKILHQFHVYDF